MGYAWTERQQLFIVATGRVLGTVRERLNSTWEFDPVDYQTSLHFVSRYVSREACQAAVEEYFRAKAVVQHTARKSGWQQLKDTFNL